MRRGPWFALVLALALPGARGAAQDVADAAQGDGWVSITAANGDWIGYGSRTVRHRIDGPDIVDQQHLKFAGADNSVTRVVDTTTSRLDALGRPERITRVTRTGNSTATVRAVIHRDSASITRETGGQSNTVTVPLPGDVRFDAGSGLLGTWDPVATPILEFSSFNLGAMTVERMTIEPVPDATLPPGATMIALRKGYDGDQLRSIARITLGSGNRVIETVQPRFGTSMTTRSVSREEALKSRTAYRVMADVLVKAPFRIAPAQASGHIRYRFSFRDGIAFAPAQTGEQRVAADRSGATLDICAECGPGLATDAATLNDARRATAWMQSDHPRLRAIAAPATRGDRPEADRMAQLEKIARSYIERPDFVGHYSALETIERRAGDCTEAAVLLAALGRAAGIPTRVVNGLVYSRERYHGVSNVFMPHSWVLAYVDGRWRSYDSALFGFDSTHVALTVGDGDPRSMSAASALASLLVWDSMTEVRKRPATAD